MATRCAVSVRSSKRSKPTRLPSRRSLPHPLIERLELFANGDVLAWDHAGRMVHVFSEMNLYRQFIVRLRALASLTPAPSSRPKG